MKRLYSQIIGICALLTSIGVSQAYAETYLITNSYSGKNLHIDGKEANASVSGLNANADWWSQQWISEDASEGYIRLKNRWSGFYLTDVELVPWGQVRGKQFVAANRNQQWKKTTAKNGTVRFQNRSSGNYLQVNGDNSGAKVVVVPFQETWDALRWKLSKVGGATVQPEPDPKPAAGMVTVNRLKNFFSNRYLNIPSKDAYVMPAAIDLNEDWYSMQWINESGPDGYIRLRNRWTGHYISDINGAEWNEVSQVPLNKSDQKQQWKVETAPGGTVRYKNRASSLYMQAFDKSNGSTIVMVKFNESWDALRWYVERVEDVKASDLPKPDAPDTGSDPVDDGGGSSAGAKPQSSTYNYGHAFQLTPLFFAANQLGTLTDTRLNWRSDSNTDGAATGGYVDAGDNILFGKAQFGAIASMCVTAHFFKDDLQELGQYDEMLRQIKHGTDFILKNHKMDGSNKTQSLVVQLSDSPNDHKRWLTIEETNHYRPIYTITSSSRGSDYAGLAAAATGLCTMHFSGDYKSRLKRSSLSLYNFAKAYRGLGHENGNIVTVYKNANRDEDEIALGALGVYRAFNDTKYLNEAHSTLDDVVLSPWAGGYEHQEQLVSNLLAIWGNRTDRRDNLINYFNNWKNVGSEMKKTSGGLVIHDSANWGSAGSITPAVMNMAIYAKATGNNSWNNHLKSQVDYMLGSNPPKQSYLCGFGTDQNCSKVHHRGAAGGSSHRSGQNNKNMLWGALLGGVEENDYDYVNDHSNHRGNEPTIGYNAQIQAALLYLYNQHGGQPISDSQLQNKINSWGGYR